MGLFERLPLPDQISSALCGGPSRSLPCNTLLVSITSLSGSPAARAADHCGSRGSLKKSAITSLTPYIPTGHVPHFNGLLRKAKFTHRWYGEGWGSSTGRIFRIKSPLICIAVRVAACTATAYWYPLPHFAAGRQRGPLTTAGVDAALRRVP